MMNYKESRSLMSVPRCMCAMVLACSSFCVVLRAEDPPWIAVGTQGMVASDSADASQAGLEILKAGGNAMDAATAISFALGVTRPYSTGVGGGGFTIVRQADGAVTVLDYREVAPAEATRDMYVSPAAGGKLRRNPSRNGHLAVAVPGLIAGRCAALKRFGTMPLARTLRPSIRLAREGFAVDDHYVNSCRDTLAQYARDPSLRESCGFVYRVHLNDGRLRKVGERLTQPALARFLEALASQGPDLFYKGEVARAIEQEMVRNGGVLRATDLANYRVVDRKAITGTYRGHTIITMPPPSSGGATLLQILNTLEPFDMTKIRRDDAPLAAHYMVEAMKHAFADRARWFGDADFSPVPVAYLTSKQYGQQLSKKIQAGRALDLQAYGTSQLPEDAGTSHFCVVDRWGNVVVSTETINTSFGSLAAVAEWGIILNNQMDDFAAEPGKPNAYGLIQSERNAIAPGKRPLSSMCPTIVLKDDKPYLLIGASGGPRIISSVLNVMLNLLDQGMTLEEAMRVPRLHHQWQPDAVFFDGPAPEDLAVGLRARGHRISDKPRGGVVQSIMRSSNGWIGASDPRKGGRPAGY